MTPEEFFDQMRKDMAFFERLALTPYEPDRCDRCRHYMLTGFGLPTRPRVCRDCKQTLIKRSIMANNWRELYNAMREELSNQYGDSADQVDVLERYPHWPDEEPVAWLHVMHMELDQAHAQVTFDEESPFGVRGKDYDPSYEVTSTPLGTLVSQ